MKINTPISRNGIPPGAVPFYFAATTANAIINGNIPAVPNRTAYLVGIQAGGQGTTVANVAGIIIGGTLGGGNRIDFTVPAGVAAVTPVSYAPLMPIPATGPNVAITVQMTAFGAGNPVSELSVQGYYL